MPSGYDYGNARVRAMHGRLLTASDYEQLLGKRSVAEILSALSETPYQSDLEAALVLESGIASLYSALRTHLIRVLRAVQSFYEGEAGNLITLLLHRWDRHNLLTVLRGQRQEIAPENILSTLVPVGQIDDVSLGEMVRQPGLRAALDLMQVWRLPYAAALREQGVTSDLDRLELALNRAHFASLRRALDPDFASGVMHISLRSVRRGGRAEPPPPKRRDRNRALVLAEIETEIDVVNIGLVLRLARRPELVAVIERRYGDDDGLASLLVEPGGQLSVRHLIRLLNQPGGVEGVVQGLQSSRYGPALQAGWQRYQAVGGSFSALERELQRYQIVSAAALATSNPLNVAVPIAYIACKQTEIANLRLAVHAVALGMPRERVREELIVV